MYNKKPNLSKERRYHKEINLNLSSLTAFLKAANVVRDRPLQ